MIQTAITKAAGWPTAWALDLAKRPKLEVVRIAGMMSFDQVLRRIKNSRKSNGTGTPIAHKSPIKGSNQLYRFDCPTLKIFPLLRAFLFKALCAVVISSMSNRHAEVRKRKITFNKSREAS